MRLSDLKTYKKPTPFVKNKDVEITVNHVDRKITGFTIVYKGKTKIFTVGKFNVLASFKKVETYLSKLK